MATQVGGDSRSTQYNVEVFNYNKKCNFVSAQVMYKLNKVQQTYIIFENNFFR